MPVYNISEGGDLSYILSTIQNGCNTRFEIVIGPGVYPGTFTVPQGTPLILRGSGEDKTFLDGNGWGTVLYARNSIITVMDLTIQNGYQSPPNEDDHQTELGEGDGGGMYVYNTVITLQNVTFKNNTARFGGGFIQNAPTLLVQI